MTGSRGVNLGRRLDRGLYADYIPVVVPQVSAKPPKQNAAAEESCTALELLLWLLWLLWLLLLSLLLSLEL